ncbi:OTU domain-containing protein 4 isoform X2 [Hyla sarda]|uniref:OTU domain-containing protein 4 isoform X2 n=1 Tax=Hyla sarda TaxID=327740 RepID=UPI0024C2D40B|nr:OTU domain-containing protein 4 isoform X2 [Hyla sarda]
MDVNIQHIPLKRCVRTSLQSIVLHSQARHLEVRQSCIKYLWENRTQFEAFIEGSFEEYLKRLENPQEWVGQVEISALSLMFSKDFIIYQEPNASPARVTDNGFSDKIMLCFSNGNHYDIIYPVSFAENAAMCQSIIYELLYEKVFGHCITKHVSKGDTFDSKPEEVFISEASGSDAENEVAGKNILSFGDMNGFKSHKDGKLPQRRSEPPSFPPSVFRSLNAGIYRNVEYEVWKKSQRDQQKLDFSIAAGMQYSVGDKCQVQLESGGVFYNAHIQEVGADNGPAVVFVEELGQKHIVQLKYLKPIPLSSSTDGWNTVAGKKIKKTSGSGTAGHTEKDNRGQRNYGKAVKMQPLPSRQQQTSMNRQHGMSSDQATLIENKGRSRTPPKVPGRKLEQSEESSYFKRENVHFGLTPEERREKQVMEESKSLYEMQNRDAEAFPALSSSDALPLKKIPALTNEKITRKKSDAEDQKNKAYKLTQPPKVSEEKLSEETKPLATSKSVVLHDVTVLPTTAEQQTPTTVPSIPAVVSPWSGISVEIPTSPTAGSDSVLQPQGTSAQFSPLPVSIPAVNQPLLPMPQTLSAYQDPLYPGFPVNAKGERATAPPPYSLCKNGDDLPTDKSILHFFYNLGIKAYTCPMWPPHLYLHPLHQAYLNICRMYPNVHVYPQSHWVQESAVNQSEVDPSVFAHQCEIRSENQSEQPVGFCPPVVQTLPVENPTIGEEIPPQPNSSEEMDPFQAQGSEFEDLLSNKTLLPQPPFGQGSYMGPLPIASPFFPHVWYGYPYQGYIENPMVRHSVFINPQDTSLSENISTGAVLENNAVQEAINQSHHFVSEPDSPLLPAADLVRESTSNTTVVKEEPATEMATVEPLKLPVKLTDHQMASLVLTEIPEGKKSLEKEVASVPVAMAQVLPPEERPLRTREESSEDEREVSNMLSSGRSKNFYNQSYGSRRPRNDRYYQTNRGGYQYNRTDEGWRGQRGRDDGSFRNFRGRSNRRRQFVDAYKPQHE